MIAQQASKRLLDLLNAQHTFPTRYTHKVIGKNTPEFLNAIADLLMTTHGLSETSKKTTSSGSHISVTLTLETRAASEIVFLIEKSQTLTDVIYVL